MIEITLNFDLKKEFLDEGLGIAIILKYEPTAQICTEHDELYVGDYESTYAKMTKEEKKLMEDSGWSEVEDSWHCFT